MDEDKRARAQAERAADPPVSLFSIILPVAPFGIPGAHPPGGAEHWDLSACCISTAHHRGEGCRLCLGKVGLPRPASLLDTSLQVASLGVSVCTCARELSKMMHVLADSPQATLRRGLQGVLQAECGSGAPRTVQEYIPGFVLAYLNTEALVLLYSS